jgi:DNA-directed RNA polymerase specialized sigma24 family protein
MRRQLSRKLSSLERAQLDDLTQEASIRLLRCMRREEVRNLDALVQTIIGRTVMDFLRCRRRSAAMFVPLTDATLNRPELEVEVEKVPKDFQERLEFTVLEFFRARRSGCFDLAREFFRHRNWRSVARDLGSSHDAIRARWSRCLSALRRAVARDPALNPLWEWARE